MTHRIYLSSPYQSSHLTTWDGHRAFWACHLWNITPTSSDSPMRFGIHPSSLTLLSLPNIALLHKVAPTLKLNFTPSRFGLPHTTWAMSSTTSTPSGNGQPLRPAIRLDDDSDRTPTSSSVSGKGLYSDFSLCKDSETYRWSLFILLCVPFHKQLYCCPFRTSIRSTPSGFILAAYYEHASTRWIKIDCIFPYVRHIASR